MTLLGLSSQPQPGIGQSFKERDVLRRVETMTNAKIYLNGSAHMTLTSNTRGMTDNVTNQAMEMGEKALEAASEAGTMVTQTAREYPIVTAAMIAGVAFALGALWKSNSWGRRSMMQGYLDRASSSVNDYLPRNLRL